tara:strand:- start:39 stop:908 length:870 start_codon:yes stop_codon:yes gene_type:complete
MRNLIVRLSDKQDYSKTLDLEFNLIQSDFLPKWIDRFLHAQQRQDVVSEPWAMYNLNDQWTSEYTLEFLNRNIAQCNKISPNMFDRTITDINNQDTLNYLHSVFELYHGQLDTWLENPIFLQGNGHELRQCLSHINQTIHRCEGHNKSPKIRVVYFDIPKTMTFTKEDYSLFTDSIDFGGVYTLYADVGKNLESLAVDDDDHHHDFVPNLHYSVDFGIRFHDDDGESKKLLYKNYSDNHVDYLRDKGYTENDPRLTTGAIKLAQLQYKSKQAILNEVSKYNNIQSVFVY